MARLCTVPVARMRAATATLVIGVLFGSLSGAQTPDFSGKWEPMSSVDGTDSEVLTITQTKDTVTVMRATPGSIVHYNGVSVTSTYKTDGSENRSAMMDAEAVVTVVSKNGQLTLVSVSKYPDGRIREITEVWSLDGAGNLVIETKDGLRGETPKSRKQVYRKRI